MSKVDLSNQPEETKVEATKSECQVPAPYRPVLGDYLPGMADMRLPRLNVVHGVGELKDEYPVGAIVYNNALAIYEPALGKKEATPPVELVVLGWNPLRYAEQVPGGGRGMLVNTPDEVRSAGGTLDYNEWILKRKDGMRRFQILAEAVVLIKQPEHLAAEEAQFPFVIDGHRWALGVWALKGTAYTNGAKVIFTARRMGCCIDGYPTCSWYVKTSNMPFKTKGDNGEPIQTSVPVPAFTPGRRTTESFQKFSINLVNGATESDAAEG